MGTPATVLEARGVNNLVKGMASKSMVNLVLAVFVASVIGVTVAYPSNVQDILNSENAENKAKIEQILSHFPPNEQQDDSEDVEKRSKSFSAWGGKRGGQQFSAWGGKRGGQQFSAWGGKRSDWVDLVRTQLAEEALREMAQRRPNRMEYWQIRAARPALARA